MASELAMARNEIERVRELAFWQELAPTLNISMSLDLSPYAHSSRSLDPDHEELRVRIIRDGVGTVTQAVEASAAERMLDGIDAIRAQFGHEVFALMYDEFWCALAGQVPAIEAVMGTGIHAVLLPLVNYVPNGDSGFEPHRDRLDDPVAADGSPHMMTAWFALTDASTERACLAVLPTSCDANFPHNLTRLRIGDVRNIRALPVRQGDAVLSIRRPFTGELATYRVAAG